MISGSENIVTQVGYCVYHAVLWKLKGLGHKTEIKYDDKKWILLVGLKRKVYQVLYWFELSK
jgi:hypothetical protein